MSIESVLQGESRHHVVLGDDEDVLPTIPSESVDAVVTDPPCGINFMGKKFDSDRGGRDAWIAWMTAIAVECLRVTKPGGHALVWALPRTSHWTAMAWENAGWEVRDKCTHLNSEGFPKNHDISKAIDKMAGATREVGPVDPARAGRLVNQRGKYVTDAGWSAGNRTITVDPPATDAAKQWEGWGTALKPASEDWWLLRKPCDQPTVAQNVLKHGTGALNIDGTRVPTNPNDPILKSKIAAAGRGFGVNAKIYGKPGSNGAPDYDASKGRLPANLVVSHTAYCTPGSCYPGCGAAALDRQSGYTESTSGGVAGWQDKYVGGEIVRPVDRTGYDDAGGASRFFNTFWPVPDDLPDHESFIYTPKPSQSERHEGVGTGPTLRLRGDLTPEQKAYVMEELRKHGVSP